MPLTVSWQYGAGAAFSVTFNITNARAKALTERYARRHGLIGEGMTDEQVVKAVIRYAMRQIADEAASTQRVEAIQAQEAAIEVAVATDNDLLAPPNE